jgi:hypothetical protein
MSYSLTVLEIAVPACAAEDLNDEVVALNVETGVYFSIRGLAAVVWRDLAAGHAIETVAALVTTATGSGDAVLDLVSQLQEHGLMRRSSGAPATSQPAMAAALESGSRDLTFEIYEDMKDLILSDPIHDVDAVAGWPARPPRLDAE